MAMVVQHNITAMNASRMLGVTTGQQAKKSEKLASGYKINRAADDAAGLSISEKMRKQIRGLDRASSNAQDGVSAVQTAEGALTEVHSMLQRMNELAVQASNGTNSEDDRKAIQDEIEQLATEIDRVAETTKFNETYLLKGNGEKTTNTLAAHDAGLAGVLGESVNGKTTFTADKIEVGDKVTIGGKEYTIVGDADRNDYQDAKDYVNATKGDVIKDNVTGTTYTCTLDGSLAAGTNASTWTKVEADGTTTKIAANALTATDIAAMTRDGNTLITAAGDSKTIVGSSQDLEDAIVGTPAFKNGDMLTDKDGNVYTYYEAATGALPGDGNGPYDIAAGWYSESAVKGFASATAGVTGDYTAVVGDTYTIKADSSKGQIMDGLNTVENIQNEIKKLVANNTVTIGSKSDLSDGKTYTIGVTTKDDGSVYTADDIAALVKEGSYVKDVANTKYYYALPSASTSDKEISLNEAYDKIAKELQAASSVGADEGKGASVKNNGDGTFEITQAQVEVDEGLSFNLQVGADADMTNKINVDIETMNTANLGIRGINVKDDSGVAATYAIDAIADAVLKVSAQRSALGAVQNRLEHTIDNLDNVVENTTAAESRIRDTDMAEEMVEYSKNNILAQAGQSMLAQANQSTQGVLSLLQ